ncbi:BREX-2 system adenine-specific DNA-methyltransferase PglX [Kitasatospora sp. NPDC088134]|uniref:BREX-2 system adenine-specific DNA-methyltransferase PglX n=1 Tax=Kitasatospora sp. NPDC088134 TaxID=3364071 RepID=UPI003826F03B
MIDRKALLADLIKQVKLVEADLKKQIPAVPEVRDRLRAEYDKAREVGRTASTWTEWSGERATQAAVAWVLGTVFVRFCEDNGLIAEPYLAAPERERFALAEERQEEFLATDAARTHRDWLLAAFGEIGAGQAGRLLFDQKHNALFQVPISHDGAKELVAFWRLRGEDGSLAHDFADPLVVDANGVPSGWDTRFLGDLYQDLSESARKTYALLQTPEFVEEFILDRTLDKAVLEFGYEGIRMIDPTCGSGHFVLGTFWRLFGLWTKGRPGKDAHERVRAAMDSVHGVDINPFAVAIARFRLLVAGMSAAEIRTLAEAGKYDWPIHLAVGDSLLKHRQLELPLLGENSGDPLAEFAYATEDVQEHKGILEEGSYHVVVGNPPYITVKDNTLNKAYRGIYKSCAGSYALSVPFAERFFQLAMTGGTGARGYGHVGQITSNSFMKREFGKKLIQEYFAHKVELTELIDTSGAYIPGHGTPTVIIIGRRRAGALRSPMLRAVQSVQGEPSTPTDPAQGVVWRAILDQIEQPGGESEWISVADIERSSLAAHPWSLSGGGASEVMGAIEESRKSTLVNVVADIGAGAVTREDDAYTTGAGFLRRRGVEAGHQRALVEGTAVRDFTVCDPTMSLWPYSEATLAAQASTATERALWPNRALLRERVAFGKTQLARGLQWFEYSMFFADRYRTPRSIAFAFVATHNHFAFDRGGKVFNRSAPVIKLRADSSDDEHLQLLGLLNSSTACFWLKQVSQGKGGSGLGRGHQDEAWEERYEFTGTKLEDFPLPPDYPTDIAFRIDTLAQRLAGTAPAALIQVQGNLTRPELRAGRAEWELTRARMIALQEELDWQVYSLYNLIPSGDLRLTDPADVPPLAVGERAFEIVLARSIAAGETSSEWFSRHNSTPITALPGHWSDEYRAIVEARIAAIETSRAIGLIERPEYKRRWQTDGWDKLEEQALRAWLLERTEARHLWYAYDENGIEQPQIQSVSSLVSELTQDEDFVSVAALYSPQKDLTDTIFTLLLDEHVPFLPALRYKPTGRTKRMQWEEVWTEQRHEDAAPDEPSKRKIRDAIPVPPKYTSADFLKPSYWKARGKLDVPKERFISYLSPTLLGWAGWDHREQAQALAVHITERYQNGAERDELLPLLAGLLELQPWLTQWHNEFDAMYSGSPASFFEGFRTNLQGEFGITDDDLRSWCPAPPARGRAATARKSKKAATPAPDTLPESASDSDN